MKLRHHFRAIRPICQQKRFLNAPRSSNQKLEGVVISLTSFRPRFKTLPFVIASLFNQTIQASKVILWLDKGESAALPKSLESFKELGLEIHETDKNHRAYRKLIPSLELYPEKSIVTADDDIIYSRDWLENLSVDASQEQPRISYFKSRKIQLIAPRELDNYHQWARTGDPEAANRHSRQNLPLGYTGVYYPPRIFSQEIFNDDVYLKLAPYADDLWFKVMALLDDVPCEKVKADFGLEVQVPFTQKISLKKVNVRSGGNVSQLTALLDHYDLWGKLTLD